MMKSIMKVASLMAVAMTLTFGFTSCSDDETYDVVGNPNNLVYFSLNTKNTVNFNIVNTPVGYFGGVDGKFPVKIQRTPGNNVKVTASLDNSLVADYNAANGTEYAVLPEGVLKFTNQAVTILADTVASKDSLKVTIDKADYSKLTQEAYLAPIAISSVEGNGVGSVERGVVYVVVNIKSSAIDKEGTAWGTALSNDVKKTWTCIAAENFDANDYHKLYEPSQRWWQDPSWDFTDTSNPNASLTIDMGQEYKITTLGVNNGNGGKISVAISSDNVTWTDCGEANGLTAVFYGGMPCRYFRVNLEVEHSSPYWTWYGANITGLNVNVEE